MPTTPGTSTVANADSAAGLCPPMPCPIFGNTYRNTKHSRNGWISVRSTNSHRCLRSTTRSRRISAPSAARLAAATERVGPPPIRGGAGAAAPAGAAGVTGAVISRAAPCR